MEVMWLSFTLLSISPLFHAHAAVAKDNTSSTAMDTEISILREIKRSFPVEMEGEWEDPEVACMYWAGVQCDKLTGHVFHLDLAGRDLHGELPSDIFSLRSLRIVDLSDNPSMSGHLPEFHEGSPLEELIIRNTNMSGPVPASIAYLSSLTTLHLSFSNFSGKLPAAGLATLANLIDLDLSGNAFSISSYSWLPGFSKLTHLTLSHMEMSGEIPSPIAGLIALKYLDLSTNYLSGPIPSWLVNLTQLVWLDLSDNQLTGKIPSCLSTLTNLSNLRLASNQLSGEIPPSLANLTQLRHLDLSFNRVQGAYPKSFFSLKGLIYLDLYSNHLNGSVELDGFHKMEDLYILDLSLNNFSLIINDSYGGYKYQVLGLASCSLRKFPTFILNQYQLNWLDLSQNNIHGAIPMWIWDVSATLDFLNISRNYLTNFENDPVLLPQSSSILTLDISFNMLQGTLPLPPLSTNFYLASNNHWSGHLSHLFCKMSGLKVLDASHNNISGVIPPCLGTFTSSLSILNLRNNKLQGVIPKSWIGGCSLKMIALSQNQLQGKLPRSLINCTMLEFIDVGRNQISDTFPSWLGALPTLKVLMLQANSFHGEIQKLDDDSLFPELRITDLSFNRFSGELPTKYFQSWKSMEMLDADETMKYMETQLRHDAGWYGSQYGYYQYSMRITNKGMERVYWKIPNILRGIDLSNNQFQGEIPSSIGTLKGLHLLNLANNGFNGSIPSFFVNLQQLESLNLSHNKFSGQIPPQLVQLNFLSSFDVSFNNLTGPIPHGGQFDRFENDPYEGNLGLSGGHALAQPQAPPLPPKSGQLEDEEEQVFDKIEWIIILMGFGSGLVVGVVMGNELLVRKPELFVKVFGRRLMRKWL